MILTKTLTQYSDFEALKDGDCVACTFHHDVHLRGGKRIRFGVFTIVRNKKEATEIILESKNNIYFNYRMYCFPKEHGYSNLKDCVLLKPEEAAQGIGQNSSATPAQQTHGEICEHYADRACGLYGHGVPVKTSPC